MRIEVFADILCPFTHVGLRRLVEERDRRNVDAPLVVHAWPLEWVNGHPIDRELVASEIAGLRASVAPELFTGFDTGVWPQTSILAFGLAASAYARDDASGEAISLALRDAVFEQGLDIADPDVLQHIGAPYGVAPLDVASAEAAARRDFARGESRSVRGSPHFFVGDFDGFCPILDITHEHGQFDISIDPETMRQFYEVAFAG
jgi:predicted DsbA family dithiol-disulfide isomerase